MTLIQLWLLFVLGIQIVHFLGTWKLYVKAGRKAWEAAIPIYNAIVLMQIINRPKWWVILLFIPIINLLMFPIIWIETIRSFGKNSRIDTALVLVSFGLYIYYVNYSDKQAKFKEERSLKPQSDLGEWVSSIAFAIIAATIVHTYVMRPYTIPTSSLEKSLLVGDYLFVSKFHYGARVPMTPIALPMVHDSIPLTEKRSFLNSIQLPYMRFPGLQKIKRNEIVVFNWPTDSLKWMWNDNSGKFTFKPIDKKTNYVKRCVAIAGDSMQIINGDIYINGKLSIMPDRAKPQFYHDIVLNPGQQLSNRSLKRYNVREWGNSSIGNYAFNLTDKEAALLRKNPSVKSVTKRINTDKNYDSEIFPHDPQYAWNIDNYGPIYIPKKGETVVLDHKSLPFYRHLIKEYEHNNNVTFHDDEVYIDGQKVTNYTFKQDYYFMMGDNRQASLDARFWGFTPFDHVVGKPVFVWFSWETNAEGIKNKIRWDRLFTTVHGEGKPKSYFTYFIILLAIYFGVSSFVKKKKA